MLPSNDTKAETARKIHSSILRAVADATQKGCADSLDMSEGNFSKWLAGDTGIRIENLCDLLAFLNLGLTGSAGGLVTVRKSDWDALRGTIALYAQKAG